MPTYDYVCEACGHEFEHFQSMSDKRLRTCPSCKKRALVRRVGAGAGVIFKGSGFYQTDYKSTGAPKSETGSAKGGSESGGKETGRAESGESKSDSPSGGGCGKPACGETSGTCASESSKPAASRGSKNAKKKGD